MADVYISCAPQNAADAHRFRNALEQRGISCSICCDALPSAVSAEDVPEPLRQAKIFVPLVSRYSIGDPRVQNELYWASEENRSTFPVRLDNAPLNDVVSFYLGTKQWITAKWFRDATVRELCDVISDALLSGQTGTNSSYAPQDDAGLKADFSTAVRIILCVIIMLIAKVVSSVKNAQIREAGMTADWDSGLIPSAVCIVLIFFVVAPRFGGYKTFLRTIAVKIWDAFRGK